MTLKVDVRDLASRAGKTFLQSFGGILSAWWISTGTDLIHQIKDVSSAERFGTTILSAVLAAAISAVHNTLIALKNDSTVKSIADGPVEQFYFETSSTGSTPAT
jgi:hypothetical protein